MNRNDELTQREQQAVDWICDKLPPYAWACLALAVLGLLCQYLE